MSRRRIRGSRPTDPQLLRRIFVTTATRVCARQIESQNRSLTFLPLGWLAFISPFAYFLKKKSRVYIYISQKYSKRVEGQAVMCTASTLRKRRHNNQPRQCISASHRMWDATVCSARRRPQKKGLSRSAILKSRRYSVTQRAELSEDMPNFVGSFSLSDFYCIFFAVYTCNAWNSFVRGARREDRQFYEEGGCLQEEFQAMLNEELSRGESLEICEFR